MNLVESIYNEPEKWKAGVHYLRHENGTRVWIESGVDYVDVNDAPVGFFQKRKIWKAYNWWMENASIDAFGN